MIPRLTTFDDFEYLFQLNEFLRSEFIEGADDVRIRNASGLKVQFIKFHFRSKKVEFAVSDPKGSGTEWKVMVQLSELKDISRTKKDSLKDKLMMAVESGDLNVSCTCPDYLYGGYKYMAGQLDYSMGRKETRSPDVRNPDLKGTVCKHILAVLNNMQWYIDDIVKSYKEEAEKRFAYKKKKK